MFLKSDFLLFLVFHICHESYEQELKAFEMNVAIATIGKNCNNQEFKPNNNNNLYENQLKFDLDRQHSDYDAWPVL